QAVEQGWVQQRIEQCATERQVQLDQGCDKLVGVNFQRANDAVTDVDVRVVDNRAVLEAQRASLATLRAQRNSSRVQAALGELENVARAQESRAGDLMQACVAAMRERATVGEVTERLERVWGRH